MRPGGRKVQIFKLGDNVGHVVTVSLSDFPTERGPLVSYALKGHHIFGVAAYLKAVAVYDGHKIAKLIVGCGHCGLVYRSFTLLPVTHHDECTVAEVVHLCRQGHSESYGEPVPQSPGAYLYAGHVPRRMTCQDGIRLPERVQDILSEYALGLKHDKQRLDAVSLAEYKAVASGIVETVFVNIQDMEIQRREYIHHGEISSRMPGTGTVDDFHEPPAVLLRLQLQICYGHTVIVSIHCANIGIYSLKQNKSKVNVGALQKESTGITSIKIFFLPLQAKLNKLNMALNQRRMSILNLIREDGHAKVQKLSEIFDVSEVTIRQDLEELEKAGYIQREYGGAFLKEFDSFAKTGMLFNQTNMDAKKEIAKKAVKLVSEGDTIILDSGSTTTELARLLVGFNDLTVITNALNIAYILGSNPRINLIVSGGDFKAPTLSLTGELAANVFKGFHVKSCFLATAGISKDFQLTYPSLSDLAVKSAMIRSADNVYLLADSSKIGNTSFATLGRLSLVDALISDSLLGEETIAKIQKMNVKLM